MKVQISGYSGCSQQNESLTLVLNIYFYSYGFNWDYGVPKPSINFRGNRDITKESKILSANLTIGLDLVDGSRSFIFDG